MNKTENSIDSCWLIQESGLRWWFVNWMEVIAALLWRHMNSLNEVRGYSVDIFEQSREFEVATYFLNQITFQIDFSSIELVSMFKVRRKLVCRSIGSGVKIADTACFSKLVLGLDSSIFCLMWARRIFSNMCQSGASNMVGHLKVVQLWTPFDSPYNLTGLLLFFSLLSRMFLGYIKL